MVIFNQKRGWIRILEAVVAILLLASVLLYLYTNKAENPTKFSNYVTDIQMRILSELAQDEELRKAAIQEDTNYTALEDFIEFNLPRDLDFRIGVCSLNEDTCPPHGEPITTENDVYVEERIISSTLDTYSPKLIRLYVWKA